MQFVHNSENLTAVFGKWPSFHDAEIIHIELDRRSPSLVAEIFAFETTRDTDEKGFYRRIHESIVKIRFEGIDEVSLDGFNHQNVIAALAIEPRDKRLHVTIEPLNGLGGDFYCESAEILDVRRGKPTC